MLSKGIIIDYTETPAGKIPLVSTHLNTNDTLGALRVRLDWGRMQYLIEPGLYGVGRPTASSPVLVSANYKLSFDKLRKELGGIDAWILVLDTKGINVWCAAGKGTFGTNELVFRITAANLEKIVNHRKLILPQLGAVGVSAHLVKQLSGFHVIYGPVRAADLPAFLEAGNKATDAMRKVHFPVKERLALVPVEMVQGTKYILAVILVFMLIGTFNSGSFSLANIRLPGIPSAVAILLGFFSGTFFSSLLLPFIPGRAFAWKGFLIGSLVFLLVFISEWLFKALGALELIALFLASTSISSFFAMNLTGGSTFTSLSGVKKEMRFAIPLQIVGFVSSLIIWVCSQVV